jgi:hypothetical protein
LTSLAAAYSLCVTEGEDYIWEAYGRRLKEAVLALAKYNIEPDPDDLEACRKHEKQIQLAMLRLHSEVQELYNAT